VLRNFLQDREALETAAVAETIAILEEEAARQRGAIDVALAAAEEAQRAAARAEGSGGRRWGAGGVAPSTGGSGDPRIATELADKRHAIEAAEEAKQRRLSELHTDLDKLRVTYTSDHPMVVAMEERIRSARVDPGELVELRREEDAILARLKGSAPTGGAVAPIGAMDQPKVTAARLKLVATVNKYEELMGRLDSARLELHAAQATFKYRYVITAPAELPRSPDKPILLMIVLLGTVFTVALAIGAAGVRELARGRFVEPWQVRRKLPVPLLAEVEEP
jgi:hypothetical protein